MKGVFWQNGQRIIRQVLDWFSASKDEIDQEYRQDYTQAGVVLDALNEFEITVGDNNAPPTTHSININTGIAYDSIGQRIEISDASASYDATNSSDTTDDGLGNFVSTPHSTGSKNIPLTANSFNYIWIDYLLVTDESVFTLQRATNAKQFYKQDDGYYITVTTVNTPPTATSVYLGSVNLSGFGVVSGSTIDMSGRSSSLIREKRVKIKTPLANLSDATATYGFNQELTLDDHIKAVGSGTVTPQNPHGTTLGDIGVDVENVVANHQKFMHNNGMIGDEASILSSLYTEFHPISPGDDFIVIKKLLVTEVVNIDGITITSSDLPNDTTFLFSSSGDAAGTYYIYLDKFSKSLVRTNIDPSSDVTKFPVASMIWTPGFTPLFDGNLTSIVDLRVFGTINNDKIDNEDSYDVAALGVHDGSVSSPALYWRSDPDTGVYRSGSGIISFTSNGVLSANISGGQITAVNGTSSAPAYSFLGDTNTGIYSSGANTLNFVTDGNEGISIDSSYVVRMQKFRAMPQIGIDGHAHIVMQVDSNPTHTWEIVASGAGGNPLTFTNWGFANSTTVNAQQQWTIGDTLTLYTGIGSVALFKTPTISGARTFTLPDVPSSNFVMSEGTQSINGGKTLTNTLTLSSGTNQLVLGSGNTFTITAPAPAASRVYTIPDAGGNATFIMSAAGGQSLFPAANTPGAPAISFIGDTNTGIYNIGADILGFATVGTEQMRLSSTAFQTALPHYLPNGSSAAPALAFTSSTNTGLYYTTSGITNFASNGTQVARVTSSGIQTVDNGYRFLSDGNVGLRLGGTTLTLTTSGHANPFEILSNGMMHFNGQPGFCAVNSSDDSLTTSGTVIQFDSERFDKRSNYNTGTSTFTAPEFGYYLFAVTVYYTLGTANVSKAIELITTLHSYVIPGEFTSAAGAITGTVIAIMNAGDTAQCILRLGAGSVTIQGNDSFGTTVFSGWKIG